jgi:acetoacetate decarboxylase
MDQIASRTANISSSPTVPIETRWKTLCSSPSRSASLEIVDPIVKYEFIRNMDAFGFGNHTESRQAIPVRFQGQMGGYVHAVF